MSSKGNSYNGAPPKYLNDFSKAIATEVRVLLAEVGRLRDERRQLQYEISQLMSVQSQHGAGGEYTPNWRPKGAEPPREPTPPPQAPESVDDAPARPGWRVVNKREERRQRAKTKALPAPPTAPVPEALPVNVPAWAQWRPNQLLSPDPRVASPNAPLPADIAPSRAGLFGPPTPPPN